tara:strand:- start:871 stop:1056 length:186 start_codon:yes stop_codon:yes gene_type:complete
MEYLCQKIEVPNKTHDILNEFYEKEYKKILNEIIEEIKEEIISTNEAHHENTHLKEKNNNL